jgi:hypothetical protein
LKGEKTMGDMADDAMAFEERYGHDMFEVPKKNKNVWITADNREIVIKHLDDDHLNNIISLQYRKLDQFRQAIMTASKYIEDESLRSLILRQWQIAEKQGPSFVCSQFKLLRKEQERRLRNAGD